MYIIKIKGKAKIPDYVQLRDENFALKAYFRADRPEKELEKLGWIDRQEEFRLLLLTLPFGKVQKLIF